MSKSHVPAREQFVSIYYNPRLEPEFSNLENKDRWFRLFKMEHTLKPMVTSLAPHKPTLQSLGIESNVRVIFDRAGLDFKSVMGPPTYKNLVYEFLSSFVAIEGSNLMEDYAAWEFRIQNKSFRWSRKEASRLLNFPEEGENFLATREQREQMWHKLTGQDEYNPSCSSDSIARTTWRYIHRLIATNINFQPETVNVVSEDDLDILWALDQGAKVNWFDVFTEKFVKMQSEFCSDFVGCTSLITRIAIICGFKFCCQFDEYKELDIACLRKLRILSRNPDGTERHMKRAADSEFVNDLEDIMREAWGDKNKEKPNGSKKKKEKVSGSDEWKVVRRFIIKEYKRKSDDESD